MFSDATKAGEKARLRTIKDLDLAASQLGLVCHLILDPNVPDVELRAAIFKTCRERNSNQLSARLIRSFVRLMTCTIKSCRKAGDGYGAFSRFS